MKLKKADMLIFENEDLPGLTLLLGEHAIEYGHAANRVLMGHPSTLCCSGVRYELR